MQHARVKNNNKKEKKNKENRKMSFRPKEKVVSVIRKFFKFSESKIEHTDGANEIGGSAKSPVRRSRRCVGCRKYKLNKNKKKIIVFTVASHQVPIQSSQLTNRLTQQFAQSDL